MQATFDKFADALYVKLKRGKVKKTLAKDADLIVDFDHKGDILGFEILQYSKHISAKKIVIPRSTAKRATAKKKEVQLPITK